MIITITDAYGNVREIGHVRTLMFEGQQIKLYSKDSPANKLIPDAAFPLDIVIRVSAVEDEHELVEQLGVAHE